MIDKIQETVSEHLVAAKEVFYYPNILGRHIQELSLKRLGSVENKKPILSCDTKPTDQVILPFYNASQRVCSS